jgi:hypothetical protein
VNDFLVVQGFIWYTLGFVFKFMSYTCHYQGIFFSRSPVHYEKLHSANLEYSILSSLAVSIPAVVPSICIPPA